MLNPLRQSYYVGWRMLCCKKKRHRKFRYLFSVICCSNRLVQSQVYIFNNVLVCHNAGFGQFNDHVTVRSDHFSVIVVYESHECSGFTVRNNRPRFFVLIENEVDSCVSCFVCDSIAVFGRFNQILTVFALYVFCRFGNRIAARPEFNTVDNDTVDEQADFINRQYADCLLYTSPSPRDCS